MSEKAYQRGGIDQGLAELLGLKGQLNSSIESVIQLAIVARDLSDSPFDKLAYPVGCQASTGGAVGEFVYNIARPGPQHCLQVTRIRFPVTGVAYTADVRVMSAADLNALGLVNTERFNKLISNGEGWDFAAAKTSGGTDASPALGTRVFTVAVAAAAPDGFVDIHPGIMLVGTGGSTTGPGLAVVNSAAGANGSCHFYGREWPSPG